AGGDRRSGGRGLDGVRRGDSDGGVPRRARGAHAAPARVHPRLSRTRRREARMAGVRRAFAAVAVLAAGALAARTLTDTNEARMAGVRGAFAAVAVLAAVALAARTMTDTKEDDMNSDATSQLWEAVEATDADAAARAIDAGADIEARGEQDRTPLVAATKHEDVETARVLLHAGADPNAQDAIQDSAFLYAGAQGLDDIVELTLEHGADVTSTNRFGGTALIPA